MKQFLLLCAITIASITVSAQTKHCKALRKDGKPCESVIIMKDGYCYVHSPSTPHCKHIKANGEPCKMPVRKEETYCHFHKDKH